MQDIDDDVQVRIGKQQRDTAGAVLELCRNAGRTADRHDGSRAVPSEESLGRGTADRCRRRRHFAADAGSDGGVPRRLAE